MSASNISPRANESAHEDSTAEETSSSGASLEIDSEDTEEQSDERDSDFDDSAYGDNQSSHTMSATSSVFNFRYENGRRYHAYAEGKYPVPNDEVCNSTGVAMHMLTHILGRSRSIRSTTPRFQTHTRRQTISSAHFQRRAERARRRMWNGHLGH
jgi:hypothetical protein